MEYLIALVFGAGIFLILCDRYRVPFFAASTAYDHLAQRQREKTSRLDIWLKGLAVWLSKRIRLSEYRKNQLQADLTAAGIRLSPEAHIANALAQSLLIGAAAIPAFLFFPWIGVLLIAAAAYLYFRASRGVAEKIKEKRRRIEYELPRFVSHIDKTLKHNRDVLNIIDTYKENAGPEMAQELEITAADMRSGNYEAALTRLESRVGSSMLSDTTRGLIGVLRGDETDAYWANLALKFADYQRQLLKAEAQKVPRKVKRLSLCLLGCFLMMYLVVIVLQIVESLGGLLGV